jgi:alpha-pyrone synthase
MAPPTAYINAIGTAVPSHDIHQAFVDWATPRLGGSREHALFRRMAVRSGIEHRWSILPRTADGGSPLEPGGFYHGNHLPSTAKRMDLYAEEAPKLAIEAITALSETSPVHEVTHLVVASCTGFVAPGVDQIIIERLGLSSAIERTLVGFMGCYAAVSALRLAHHIVRSEPGAQVLVVAVELSTLHLSETQNIESLLAMLQFGDGAAAALISAEPSGLALGRFFCTTLPGSTDLIQWTIGDEGFEMKLSGQVPGRIGAALRVPHIRDNVLQGRAPEQAVWAVHAGGRSILDAVEGALDLPAEALAASRSVLARFGNMSSATLMFVLADLIDRPGLPDGIALAFGPGLAAEGFSFTRPCAALLR